MKFIYVLLISFICLLAHSFACYAQSNPRLVIDGVYIRISQGTSTTPNYWVIGQNDPNGITRLSGGGHIYTDGQYNFVKWNAGTATGNFVFPFGVAGTSADYIPFTFNKTSSASSSILASTWNTNQQNVPHPGVSDVSAVTIMTGVGDSITTALDRFWDIRTSATTTASLTFSYRGSENTISSPTASLKVQRWTGNSCGPWTSPAGPGNTGVTSGIGTVGPVTGQTVFTPFVMVNSALPLLVAPAANAGADKIIYFGNSVQIGGSPTATGGTSPYTYSWTPSASLNSSTVANPIASPLASTTYTLTVTDARGCSSSDVMTVTVNAVQAYAIPKKTLDGGFYKTLEGLLYFKFNEEYLSGNIKFTIYNDAHVAIASNSIQAFVINSVVKYFGDNRYVVTCYCLPFPSGYYTVELINDKKEVVKLRFYYDGYVPNPSPC